MADDPSDSTVDRLEDLLAEWFDQKDAGRHPRPEDLTADPAMQDQLRAHIAAVEALGLEATPAPVDRTEGPADDPAGPTVDDHPAPEPPGYRILRELARGGMGVVYAAEDPALGREVAVKVLKPGAPRSGRKVAAARFALEARVTGRLEHPNVPPVHALGRLPDGSPFLAMKLIRGKTLDALIRERADPADDLPQLIGVFEGVCQAVGFAHAQGVIHRDLKPQNVMVGAFGEVQVMDWGLAKELRAGGESVRTAAGRPPASPPTRRGSILGTPAYMSPEQARGEEADARSDVFSLGGILCAILTGRPPFVGKNADEVHARAMMCNLADADERLDRCDGNDELVDLARWCMRPKPEVRPADGKAVTDQLAIYRAGVEERLRRALAERAAAGARAADAQKRRRTQVTAGAVAGALVVAAATYSGIREWGGRPTREGSPAAAAEEVEAVRRAAAEVVRLREANHALLREAVRRDKSREALRRMDQAGMTLTAEDRADRAAALDAVGEPDAAWQELKQVGDGPDDLALRARLLLLRADLRLAAADGLDLVRQLEPLTGHLSPADRAYHRGFTASGLTAAEAAFRQALDADPRHLHAREHLGLVMAVRRRFDDLDRHAQESHRLYPEYPPFKLLQQVAAAAKPGGRPVARKDAAGRPPGLLLAVAFAEAEAELRSPDDVPSPVGGLAERVAGLDDRRLPPFLRPALALYKTYLDPLAQDQTGYHIKLAGDDHQREREQFKAAIDAHKDGFAAYHLAAALRARADFARRKETDAECQGLYAAAAAAMQEAAGMPDWLVDRRAAALDGAVVCLAAAGGDGFPAGDHLRRAADLATQRFDRYGAPKDVSVLEAMAAAVLGRAVTPGHTHPALAQRVAVAWAAAQPGSPRRMAFEAELAYRDEADAKAVRLVGQALAGAKGDEGWAKRAVDVQGRAAERLAKAARP